MNRRFDSVSLPSRRVPGCDGSYSCSQHPRWEQAFQGYAPIGFKRQSNQYFAPSKMLGARIQQWINLQNHVPDSLEILDMTVFEAMRRMLFQEVR